jgi:hypothetical protein
MKSELLLVVLIAWACVRADCLGNNLNSDSGVDAHDASVRAEAWRVLTCHGFSARLP